MQRTSAAGGGGMPSLPLWPQGAPPMTPKTTSWSPRPGLHTIPASGEKSALCPQHLTKDEPRWAGREEKPRWSRASSECHPSSPVPDRPRGGLSSARSSTELTSRESEAVYPPGDRGLPLTPSNWQAGTSGSPVPAGRPQQPGTHR